MVTYLQGVRYFYTALMALAAMGKLTDKETENDWTRNLNYCKWFQYAVGVVEVFMALASGYNAFYKRDDMINMVSIFLGFVLVGGSYYTFLLRARIKPSFKRIIMCIIPSLTWLLLYAWIVLDELVIPNYIWSGVLIGFLGGLIIPEGTPVSSKKAE